MTRSNLRRALDLSLDKSPEEAAALLGSGQKVTAQDTVPFALWCAARHLDSYPEALWATVAGGGDMDTTGAMVGSIVVLCAREGIPEAWLTHAEPLSQADADKESVALCAREGIPEARLTHAEPLPQEDADKESVAPSPAGGKSWPLFFAGSGKA